MPAIDAGRSAVHSCRGASASEPPGRLTRRSFSDSFHSVTARTAGWLRRAAVVSLLGLPLLFGLATQAVAQTVPTLKVEVPTITEGETGIVTFTLSEASTQTISFEISVNILESCSFGITCPPDRGPTSVSDFINVATTITFDLGETTRTFSITPINDNISEPTEVLTLQIDLTNPFGDNLDTTEASIDSSTPADGDIGFVTYWLIHIFDDDRGFTNIIPGTSPVTEGTGARFTVITDPIPTDNLLINLFVSEEETDGHDFVDAVDEGSKTVTILAGEGSATYTVATVNDSTTEADGTVTVTLHDGTGYTIGSANTATIAIDDDDYTLSVTIDNTEGIEGDSGSLTDAATLTFTVNPPRPGDFYFLVCLDGGTAERGDSRDYRFMPPNNRILVAGGSGCVNNGVQILLPANTPSVEAKILVNGDSLFEADETVIVSLQRVTGVPTQNTPDDVFISDTAGSVTYTIRNDDEPVITITADDTPIAEGTSASFTITASPTLPNDLTINLTVTEDETGGQNFVAASNENDQTVILPAGAGSVTHTIGTILDNTIGDDNDGTLTVALATGDGYTVGTTTHTAVVTITNNVPHVVSISIEPAAGDEGNSGGLTDAATLTFTVNPPRPERFMFGICLDGGTAERGSSADYQYTRLNDTVPAIAPVAGGCDSALLQTQTLFNNNQASFNSKIRVNGDSLFEEDETVTVSLQRANNLGGNLGTPADVIISPTAGSVTYTIRNDDDPPMISIAGGSPATEGAGTLTYTLTADKPPVTDLIIDLTVMDAPGSDFIAAEGDQTVTFPAGTTALNYEIPITDDEVDEASGEVTVTINDGTGYTAGTDTATIRVRDDDRTIVTLAENPAGDLDEGASKQITLTLNRPLVSGEAQVFALKLGGTATVNTDYTLAGIPADGVGYEDLASGDSTIVFTGQTSGSATTATLTMTAIADGISDPGEVITMRFATSELTSPDGDAGIQDTRGDGPVSATRTIAFRITEQPALVLNPSTLTIDEGDTATYTVSLATQPNAAVAMTVSGQADTDLTLSDDTLNFTMMNWNQPQTITVTAGSDDDAQSDDPIALLHTATGGNYAGVTGEVTVTITEDDTAGITVQPTTLAVDEDGTNNYTVVLTSAPADEVIITVDSGTIATVNNDMLTFTQSNWNQAQTVTVTGMDDAVHNTGDARSGTITHAISQGDSGDYRTDREIDSVQLTVADNDDPTLSIQVVGDHTDIEEGGTRTIRITVSPDTGESFMLIDVRPLLRISDGYELTLVQTDTSLDPTLQFEVSVTDNDQDGADGMLTIDVSSVTGYAAGSPAMVQLTVNDNDEAGITVQPTTLTVDEGGTDSYTVVLTSQPAASVTVTATPGTGITMTDTTLTFTSTDWNQPQTLIVTGLDNNDDDASDRRVTIRHTLSGDTQYSGLSIDDLMVMVDDDDPTEVSLTRTGSTGAIDEGQAVTFTVELGRALIAGEIIEVPLSIAGTDVELTDWSLALQSGTGVVLSSEDTMTPQLSFENAGVQSAQLTLTAIGDNTMEGSGSETFIIALGPDGTVTNGFDHSSLNTNVGGGADPGSPDHFSVQVNDATVMPMITITGGTTVTEGIGSASFTLTATPPPTDALTLMLNVSGGSGFITTSGAQTVALNGGSRTVTYLIATQGDTMDEPNGTVTVTVGNGTGYEVGDPSVASVGVHDDDATTVTLVGTAGDVAEGSSKPLTLTLGRALEAGEQLTVPLTFGGTAVFGTDYTLTGTAANGVDYSDLSGGSVTFSAGGEVATLPLMAQTDAVAETGGETVRIALGTLDGSSGTNLGGGASGTGNVDFTIQEQPALVLSTTRLTLIEGDSASYRVSLAAAPSANVVMVTLTGTNAELRTDNTTLTFTSQNWGNPQTVTLTAVTDSNTVTDQVTLTHSADAGYNSVTASLTVELIDSTPQLSFSQTTIELNEGDSTTYTLQLSAEPVGTVTVALSGYDGTALAPQPLELTFTQDNWNQAQTITLSAGTDSNSVNEAAVTLVHTADAGYGEEVTEDVTVTMTDIDAPRLIVGVNTLSVTEQGSATYTVTLSTEPSADVTVTITGQSGDLRVDSGTELTFTQSNWNEGQVVTLSAIADDDSEDEALITLTHTASGGGYGTASAERLSVRILDSTRGLVLSESSLDMEENDTASYTVRLALRPMADVTVRVSSGDATRLRVTGGDSLTFTPTNWNQAQTVTVMAADDIDSDANRVLLTHMADAGYGSVQAVLPVEIADDDVPRLLLSVDELSLIEGGSASYTVALGTRPSGNVTVALSGQGSALRPDRSELTFDASNWAQAQTITLTAVMDTNTDDGQVRLTHTASGGYSAAPVRLPVTITDSSPQLQFSRMAIDLDEGGSTSYTVRLSARPVAEVTVMLSGHAGTGMSVNPLELTFGLTDWNQAQTITLTAGTDSNSVNETITLTHSANAGYGEVTEEVTVTVRESADMTAMQAAQQMWLPRFGLTAVEHMLGGLDYRFTASSQPGLSGNLNGLPRGQSFNAAHLLSSRGSPDASAMGIEQLGAGSSDRPRKLSRTLSLPKLLPSLLRGSHFTFTDQDGTSIWGQAAYTKYKDGEDAGTSIDGEVTTAMLGIDRDNGQTLVGLALAYSDSDGEWQDASDEGKQSGMLVSMLPYLHYDLSERLQLWGAASYGRGDLKQTSTGMESKHNLVQLSATAGLRGTLLERPVEEGGLTLELISGLTLARIEADDSRVMAGTEADTQRFRMGLAWSWQLPEEDGVRLTPELELGLRYDGGDTSEGFGLELGGGLSWQTPAKGLTVDIRGRYLLEHEAAEREEWGLSGSLRYEAWPNSAYGPSFSLRHEYGNAPAASGLDRLLSDSLTDALEEEDNRHTAAVSSRWTLKGEWGFALTDDATGIPYASLSASDAKRDLTLGWRLLSNPAGLKSKLDIKAIRREQDDNNPRHSVGAQWKLNW